MNRTPQVQNLSLKKIMKIKELTFGEKAENFIDYLKPKGSMRRLRAKTRGSPTANREEKTERQLRESRSRWHRCEESQSRPPERVTNGDDPRS